MQSMKAQMSMKTHDGMKANKKLNQLQSMGSMHHTSTSFVRYVLHLENTCRVKPGTFSCAIDSFIEMAFHSLYPRLKEIGDSLGHFSSLLVRICEKYDRLTSFGSGHPDLQLLLTEEVRNPVWNYVISHCDSFRARDANAEFSQIFQEHVFGIANDLEKAMFLSTYEFNETCFSCQRPVHGSVSTFLQYVSWNGLITDQIKYEWPSLLFTQNLFVNNVNCSVCNSNIPISNVLYVTPSTFIFIEFAPNLQNSVEIMEEIIIGDYRYKLSSVVRNSYFHFSVVVNADAHWYFIDDLKNKVEVFQSFRDLKNKYENGWFFCLYTVWNAIDNVMFQPENVGSPIRDFSPTSSENDTQKKINVTEFDHNYSCKLKTIDSDLIHTLLQDHCYSKFRAEEVISSESHKINEKNVPHEKGVHENDTANRNCKGKRKQNISKASSKKQKRSKFPENLTHFDIAAAQMSPSGYEMIINFYDKLAKYQIKQCSVCKEAWPSITNQNCSRCAKDKGFPKKFSIENNMVPSPTPEELMNLSQVEEMLIARLHPVMNVYCKPRGGQKAYKGHVITFPSDVQTVANVLPHIPSELPIIKILKKDSSFISKDFRVRKAKVMSALNWLVKNNPVYSDVNISNERIECLPDDGNLDIDIDDNEDSYLENEESFTEIPVDIGPDNEYADRPDEMSSFLPTRNAKSKLQTQLVDDYLKSAELDIIGNDPINEFNTQFLATMAFPTLFCDAKADPTNLATLRNIASNDLDSFALKIKHLLKFAENIDGKWVYRFAKHPRFAYWAYNILFRRRILSKGNLYVKRNPGDVEFTVEDFHEMINQNSSATLMSKIFYYTKEITGSNSYWNRLRQELTATIKQVGVPTIFFTLSMAEYHWPDFLNLFSEQHAADINIKQLIAENPHIIDWYFTERTAKFVKSWLYDYLNATWHWYRFEYASRGSIHCHGMAKLDNDPGLVSLTGIALKGYLASKQLKSTDINLTENEVRILSEDIEAGLRAENQVCSYIDTLLSAVNPVGDDIWQTPPVHPCKNDFRKFTDSDLDKDYENLVNSVQKHVCSSAYCLKEKKGEVTCRFNFPYECSAKTQLKFSKINTKDGSVKYKAEIFSLRNDPRVNRHQRVQLQGWRANCDISVVIDYHSCVEYLTKYASKPEKLSSVAEEAFSHVANKISENEFDPVSIIKKLMMRTVGLRDMSIQEVCHHILQLKLFSSSFEVLTVSLNGNRKVENLDGDLQFKPSYLDLYANREDFVSDINVLNLNFVTFFSQFTITGNRVSKRKKEVVLRTIPNYSSCPKGFHYDLYCKYNLIKYKVWHRDPTAAWDNVEETSENLISCWHNFLQTEEAEQFVPNYLQELENAQQNYVSDTVDDSENDSDNGNLEDDREDWMFLANFLSDTNTEITSTENADYWRKQSSFEPNEILEMPNWINGRKSTPLNVNINYNSELGISELENIKKLNKQQQKAFEIVCNFDKASTGQLLMIITGQAGNGKSFLIDRLHCLLNNKCIISALFGIAAYNIHGKTLHHILKLPIRGKRNEELKGSALAELQETMKHVSYLIIDEFSVISQRDLAWVNRRCKQAKGSFDKPFGGINVILVGDLGQLPPVNGKVLYSKDSNSELDVEGSLIYNQFTCIVELQVNQRAQGRDNERFRELLSNVRDGKVTLDDWKLLLTRAPNTCNNRHDFLNSLKLCYSNKDVLAYNLDYLKELGNPIAKIPALHSKRAAAKCSTDDMSGLQSSLHVSVGSRIMLTRNLWTNAGLCNGALGTVHNIVYSGVDAPPAFPVAILIKFDSYSGPSFSDTEPDIVPIPPCSSFSETLGSGFERTQFPIRLAWAMTIHKSQGLTLKNIWIDLGQSERSVGLSYVALSRVKSLNSLIVEPMSFERLTAIGKSKSLNRRIEEEKRLKSLSV